MADRGRISLILTPQWPSCLISGSAQRRTCRGGSFAVRAGGPGSEQQDAESQAEEERIERLEKLTGRRKPTPPQLRQRRADEVRCWLSARCFPVAHVSV